MGATTAAKEFPILFSGPMVTAIRAGRKSMTRRVMKQQPERHGDRMRWCPPGAKYDAKLDMWIPSCEWDAGVPVMETGAASIVQYCPYGKPGDRLWCRESHRFPAGLDGTSAAGIATSALIAGYAQPWAPVLYTADGATKDADLLGDFGGAWGKARPSIHMPRWASRVLLEITDVRVERLQAISEADAAAEGFRSGPLGGPMGPVDIGDGWTIESSGCIASAAGHFLVAFEAMYGEEACMSNPWLWAVSFRVLEGLAS